MKLVNIWNAVRAFQVLHTLKKSPGLAYKLLKYSKKVEAELEICEARRQQYVYEVSGATPGEHVEIPKGTPEYDAFLAKFNEFLREESDLPKFDMTMGEMIEALGAETGNAISEDELELLEPFFN